MAGGLLGVLSPGERRLKGKSFYLDNVKRRSAALLVEAIFHLGGKVESFLHKDVSFVVAGSKEASKEAKTGAAKTSTVGGRAGANGNRRADARDDVQEAKEGPRQGTPRPMCFGSRGKALLEKAIRNNERLQGNSVLDNARSWGVKVLYVDDLLLCLQRLTRECSSAKQKKAEQKKTTVVRVVKAASLKAPYVKVEDLSRKYKPLHGQSMAVPSLCYGGRFSPFEPPPPPRLEKQTNQEERTTKEINKVTSVLLDRPETPPALNPSPWRAHKKDRGYCECCLEPFSNQEEHLRSDKHRGFLLEASNYSVLEQLVADLQPGFSLHSAAREPEPPLNSLPTSPCDRAPSPQELEVLGDAETEHAVHALLNPASEFSGLFPDPRAPTTDAPGRPADPSRAPTPASRPPLAPGPGCPAAEGCPRTPSPEAPRPAPRSPLRPPSDAGCRLSPCPAESLDRPSDPHSLPPLLSPQDYILEPHSSYSDPPVLSPQIPDWGCAAAEDMEASGTETRTTEAATMDTHDGLWLSPGLTVRSESFPELPPLAPHRCTSLPRSSTVEPNLKKRSRSASPGGRPTKRRRSRSLSPDRGDAGPQNDPPIKREDAFAALVRLFVDLPARPGQTCAATDRTPEVDEVCTSSSPPPNLGLGLVPPGMLGAHKRTFTTFLVPGVKSFPQSPGCLTSSVSALGDQPPSPVSPNTPDCSLLVPTQGRHGAQSGQWSHPSHPHSMSSVCIESVLVPDVATLSPSSSDSDWDCGLLGPVAQAPAGTLPTTGGCCGVDQELLQRPCAWTHDSSYEARLHSALEPSAPPTSLCGEEREPSAFSRTVVQVVHVQH